ncbi:MAG TPA: glutamine-hydrolyzing GMP synthase [Candidatus Binataceae bacterium]|nr:glutamine-hydrolyzing GMP synthase [Candidatus Binataceae bacterium]
MILILDFGSQYTQLIARRVREAHVYCELHPFNLPIEKIRALNPRGIILSGGPASMYEDNAPDISDDVLNAGCPVLGICYGMYVIAQHLGARSVGARAREYGPAMLVIDREDDLFAGISGREHQVWMSHGDRVEGIPDSICAIGHSTNSPYAAIRTRDGRLRGIQFHPEVVHTPCGTQVLRNFVIKVCGEPGDWTMANFIETKRAEISRQAGSEGNVLMGLSGGVDSSVAAALIHCAIGRRLKCVFVDTGLLRAGERERMETTFARELGIELKVVDASALFIERLAGVLDPEQKRRVIGHTFIDVFEKEANAIGDAKFLGQGTLYPDVIESVSFKGPSAVIKSHHNVGGLPERMRLELIEPLRELFKDEVREVGRQLGLAPEVVDREPFPGPGLAVRIVGEVTRERLDLLRRADAIVMEEIAAAGCSRKLWQAFGVLLPLKTVGVMGDSRTYESVLAIRAVESQDGMTADWARLDPALLARISSRVTNEIKGINRIVYDITSKPPATIEWE